ncbi:hypothetical protein [Chitinophaga skermanii]|nr:hypothetical protein [Chitinophaga skermanii]
MVNSIFIAKVLDALIAESADKDLLKAQLPFITEEETDYTGVGVFVNFSHEEEAEAFKAESGALEGVTITSPLLPMGASAILFITDGIIDMLEIFALDGEYPMEELSEFTLVVNRLQ